MGPIYTFWYRYINKYPEINNSHFDVYLKTRVLERTPTTPLIDKESITKSAGLHLSITAHSWILWVCCRLQYVFLAFREEPYWANPTRSRTLGRAGRPFVPKFANETNLVGYKSNTNLNRDDASFFSWRRKSHCMFFSRPTLICLYICLSLKYFSIPNMGNLT